MSEERLPTKSEQDAVAQTVAKLTDLGYPAVANYNFSQVKIYGSDLVDENSPLKRKGA
jgi:hypothetical protein